MSRPLFYRNEDALNLLRDAGAFDDACVSVYFDLDLSTRRYHSYFPTNHRGQRMAYLDATRLHELSDLIRRDLGSFGTGHCLTIVLGVGLAIPAAIGGPPGRTPATATPVAGSNPPVWRMDTENISYLIDTAPAASIPASSAALTQMRCADRRVSAREAGLPGKSHEAGR